MEISTKQMLLGGLLAGLCMNVCDVTVTVTTVAKRWTGVLESQGLRPSPFTPPYYVTANFLAGIGMAFLLSVFAASFGMSRQTALMVSLCLWAISRLYGAGHVVMRQMPLDIYSVMSAGLLLGMVVGGQVLYWYYTR